MVISEYLLYYGNIYNLQSIASVSGTMRLDYPCPNDKHSCLDEDKLTFSTIAGPDSKYA